MFLKLIIISVIFCFDVGKGGLYHSPYNPYKSGSNSNSEAVNLGSYNSKIENFNNCDQQYTNNGYVQFDGGLYKFHRNPQKWATARSICDTEGAHLAIVNSPSEANFLVSLFNPYPANILWDVTYKDSLLIGFHDFFREGEYVSLDGSDLETSGYNLWEAEQPNGLYDQNCGSLSRRGLLNDFPCSIPSVFVCEVTAGTSCANVGRIRPRKIQPLQPYLVPVVPVSMPVSTIVYV